jgi:hypothetical protein
MRLGFVGNSTLKFDGKHHWYQGGEWRYLQRVALLFDALFLRIQWVFLFWP